MKEILIAKSGLDESVLYPLFIGSEQCAPSHRFGPFIRPYYLVHFCLSGKGRFWDKNGEHELGAGELFVIRPDEVTTYEADAREPWHYCWIAFRGERGKVFDAGESVYATPLQLGERLQRLFEREESASEAYLSLLYELIYQLFLQEKETAHSHSLQQVCRYIRYHYMEDLRVTQLAQLFGYERSYFYRLFKREMGKGVKDYITGIRMERAREFLFGGHSVSDVAHMVGYGDEFNFSRAFKLYFGAPPKSYKK